MRCTTCGVLGCRTGKTDKLPEHCPMVTEPGTYPEGLVVYEDPAIDKLSKVSATVVSRGYCKWTRIEEIVEFCRLAGFHRLGLAFCVSMQSEARLIQKVFEENGLEVLSVICKTGAVPKEQFGLDRKGPEGFEAICNPVVQAKLLNKANTDFNVVVGLCLGHDSIFLKFSEAPATVLVVRDTVLANNPMGAIYCSGFYSAKLAGHSK